MYKYNLPVSQFVPEKPEVHSQRNPFTKSTHVAPFIQGKMEHSMIPEYNITIEISIYY